MFYLSKTIVHVSFYQGEHNPTDHRIPYLLWLNSSLREVLQLPAYRITDFYKSIIHVYFFITSSSIIEHQTDQPRFELYSFLLTALFIFPRLSSTSPFTKHLFNYWTPKSPNKIDLYYLQSLWIILTIVLLPRLSVSFQTLPTNTLPIQFFLMSR